MIDNMGLIEKLKELVKIGKSGMPTEKDLLDAVRILEGEP